MIWNDVALHEWADNGGVEPYNLENINPASIDLSWSGKYCVAGFSAWGDIEEVDQIDLQPGYFYLLDTAEYITMPPDCVGKLFLKSSAGRMGIEHLHAGYIDPGFEGTLTLEIEIRVRWPITIYRGTRLVQLTVEEMIDEPVTSYKDIGRYCGQNIPTLSKGLPK